MTVGDGIDQPPSAVSVAALVLADGRLPTGGHAHSAGLEPALAGGLRAEQIIDYIAVRLSTVGITEAATAVLSRRAWVDHNEFIGDEDSIGAIIDAFYARTPSAPLRAASEQLGRGMFRLARRLWPDDARLDALAKVATLPRPVALGVVAAICGLSDAQTARTSLYDDVQTVAYAAPKLLPTDPVEPVRWVLASSHAIERSVTTAVEVTSVATLPALTAPELEIWSIDHAHRTRRIFHA